MLGINWMLGVGQLWYNLTMSIFGSLIGRRPLLDMVVDVGSHAIKALLFESVRETSNVVKKPTKRFSDQSGQSFTPPKIIKKMFFKLPVAADEDKVINRLREFMFTVVKEFERVPGKILVAVGPNLAEESLRLWTIRPSPPVKNISSRGLNIYFQSLFEAHRDAAQASLAYPCNLLVNGYTVTPDILAKLSVQEIGFKTLILSFKNAAGVSLTEMRQSLGGMPIEFIPLAAALKEVFISYLGRSDAFLIDVGGEETSLILIKNSEIMEIASFAVGAHHFLRGIAKLAGISLEEAEDKKRQYIQGLVSEKVRSQMQKFLSEESLLWKKEFLAKLDYFYHLGPLPSEILLFGGGAHLPEIAAILRGNDWLGGFSYTASAEVRVVDAASFFQGSSLGGFLQGPEDVGLASLVTYANFNAKKLWA